ncbi:MAG: 4-hydroxyphenylpyruvate dioxygenase [Bdellovibrionales bacterium]
MNSQNPIGLNGVSFIEYSSHHDHELLPRLFLNMGFKKVSTDPEGTTDLYRQGKINFHLNRKPGSFADLFSKAHGPCISATGFRVLDAKKAFQLAVQRGAKAFENATDLPAVYGIGDSLIYFVDQELEKKLYSTTFKITPENQEPIGFGLNLVDHFTNNVPRGEMQKWCDFYEKVFNFRETRYFNIKGQHTGLESKVMRSPCGQFSVPINEPTEKKSQIQEYLDEYKGSGIQHLALTTNDIVKTLETMKNSKVEFLTPPPKSYYAMLKDRVPNVIEDVDRLEKNAILVDGDQEGYLLQIFTKNVIGPIFFELIQRKNHSGFGEGNFQALFDAIERDQRERGYL